MNRIITLRKTYMKAFTDIEQSKKLAEILPIESADMRYGYTAPFDFEVSGIRYDGGYDNIPIIKTFSTDALIFQLESMIGSYLVGHLLHYLKLFQSILKTLILCELTLTKKTSLYGMMELGME